MLTAVGWELLNWAVFPIIIALLVPLLWQWRGASPLDAQGS
jgi:hypothetical protein